ncbi:MAG: hypothetical protein JRJ85_28875 [Deltaproteobacteria bacterium]|nr:hypothetical protein [Deltaproteobacteria bacterium]
MTFVNATTVNLAGFSATTTATDVPFNLPGRAVVDIYHYRIFIQDTNGNPPIQLSNFAVTTWAADGAYISTVLDVTYPDVYTYTGTFRDPSDFSTWNPYAVRIDYSGAVAETRFTFTPACTTAVPGCSGSSEKISYFN